MQSTIHVKSLVEKAIACEMPAVAFSDSGNMMGAFHFVESAYKHNAAVDSEIEDVRKKGQEKEIALLEKKKILPIVGCEFQVCHDWSSSSNIFENFSSRLLIKLAPMASQVSNFPCN